MKSYLYKKVDAFTSGASKGNPAAFIDMGKDRMSPEAMGQIAKEHQGFVSEVVFVSRGENNLIEMTYYSSECEVDFCGHGTIATMYEMVRNDQDLKNVQKIEIWTHKKGKLWVYNEIKAHDAVYIAAPDPLMLGTSLSSREIAPALGIDPEEIFQGYPIDLIDAGLRTLIVPLARYATEISVYPEIHSLKDFCEKSGVDIVLIFSKEVCRRECVAHTRVFAPKYGYLEDPATGSGNSAFGYYLLKNNLWQGEMISIEQGGDNRIFNEVRLKVVDGKVLFGGKATLKISGTYFLAE